jgi:hypothetical protein
VLPKRISNCDTPGDARDIEIYQNYVYIDDGSSLQIIDVSNIMVPVIVNTLPVSKSPHIRGNTLYLLSYDTLYLYDLTNPAAPVSISNLGICCPVKDIELNGDRIYITDETGMITIVDISNPVDPVYNSAFETNKAIEGITISNDRIYLACEGSGIYVYSLNNPDAPEYLTCYSTPNDGLNDVYDLWVEGDYIYAPIEMGGLMIVNGSSAGFPGLISNVQVPSSADCIRVNGDFIYAGVSE